jgi:dihydroflavonol-4-reductase
MAKDRALITGASGFVGSAVVRAALDQGLAVRALVRRTSPRGNLTGLDAEIIEGDILDSAAMARALAGVRYLFHVAADYRLWARDPNTVMRVNVEGTRTVMSAALRCGVERIVHTSSVATLRPAEGGVPVGEDQRLEEGEAIGAYKRSKIAAERLVERMVDADRLPAVMVQPSTPIGPRDIRPTPTGRIIVEAAAGRMPAFVDTGLNFVGVDDVAAGHLFALHKGRIGERYILGGDNVSLRNFLTEVAKLTGRRPPRIGLPRWPLYPLALIAEARAQVTGKEPLLTLDGLKMSRHHMFFTSAKAARELGYAPKPHAAALADAIVWFREAGYLA